MKNEIGKTYESEKPDHYTNNKRIAKNTLMLYLRTIITMLISLYTSRVILQVLGVENYGIYNVVGGVVAMFSVISGSLSSSISRFITFELGRNNYNNKLQTIFSTSVNVQIILSLVIILLGESLGIWFLNSRMDIPSDRLYAANWVLHCSLLSFCVCLISVPYDALIIAHEKMSAFAYISIIEVILKLIIVYALYLFDFDKLIIYSILTVIVSVIIRIIYGSYSSRHFEEARYKFHLDKRLSKEISSFAGWSFLTNAAYIFNTQGVNILVNLFFGVTVNTSRGITVQVEGAVMKFVNNFTVALNPQITKSYASGEYSAVNMLICRGAKFSYFLLLVMALPIMLETEYILKLWLNTIPEYTIIFIRLSFIATMIQMLGNTSYTACMATGNIKKYTIVLTIVGCLVFPLSWMFFSIGFPPSASYVAFILVYLAVDIVRLFLMKELLNFPPMLFIKKVILKISIVTLMSLFAPLIVDRIMDESFVKFVVVCFVSILSAITSIYYLGLSRNERSMINGKIKTIKSKMFK